jgi:hypothetical protein
LRDVGWRKRRWKLNEMELDLDLDEFCKKFLGWKMINKKGKFGG